ncbi:ricin-type beta-trefoil lectin domain protein [Streptosporangiaceae bacterium NEAU-GS5]|nr:ricin-type beta-trefoil lectin domain protein [Streptosporangiaceae bacterium NEAU-GS5]
MAVLLAAMTALGALGVAAPAQASSGPYLMEFYIGTCLTVYNGTGNGQQVMQWSCDGYPNGQWWFDWTDSGWAKIRNDATGKCLTVYNGTGVGSAVMQWNCDGYANGQWYGTKILTVHGRDFYYLRNRATGLCMQLAQRGLPNGIVVVQASCRSDIPEQRLTWYPALG